MSAYKTLVVATNGFVATEIKEGTNIAFDRSVAGEITLNASGGGGAGVSDGDKGDITVSASGATWTIDAAVISTYGRTLTVAANAAAARSVLGLGTAALSATTAFDAAGAAAAAQAASQPLDSDLTAIAALTTTSYGRDFLTIADAAAALAYIGAGATGLTSLNGETGGTQTFAKVNDTNVTLTIGSATNVHTFTLGWNGTLADARIASAATWNSTSATVATLGTMAFASTGDYTPTAGLGSMAFANSTDYPTTMSLGTMAFASTGDYTPTMSLGSMAFASTGDYTPTMSLGSMAFASTGDYTPTMSLGTMAFASTADYTPTAGLAALAFANNAAGVPYDHTASGLTATDVQAAIDEIAASGGGGGLSDGDKGDITVSAVGATWTIDADVISTYGRTLTVASDAAAARTVLELGTMALEAAGDYTPTMSLGSMAFESTSNYSTTTSLGSAAFASTTDFDTAGAAAAAQAASQPLDSDLTDIAALTTTSYGRDFLILTDAADARSYIGVGGGSGDALVADPLNQFAATTSAQLAGVISDELGTGKLIFSAGTLDIAAGKTLTASNTLTLTGTDGSTLAIGTGGTLGTAAYTAASAYQPIDATLTALAALTIAANSLTIGTGTDAFAQTTFAGNTFPARASTGNLVAKTISDFALTILDDADAAAVRTTIGAGTGSGTVTAVSGTAPIASSGGATPAISLTDAGVTNAKLADMAANTIKGRITAGTGVPEDLTAANVRTILSISNIDNTSDASKPVSTAQQAAIDAAVVGLWDFKGVTDCSANPNYPAALKGDTYKVSVAGKIGGASGTVVSVGDTIIASADNAGGTQASVGTSWFVLEANVPGITTVGNAFLTLANPSAITFPRVNADNSVTALSAAAFLAAIGSGTGDALVADPLNQFAATTSAQLAGVISDELGTGKLIFSAGTLDIAAGKTLTASNTLTLTGTDGSTLAIGTGGTLGTAAYTAASAYQPIDATLTALAALTIAANSLTIGTGTDAFAQTTFAGNTFPARASTGNLVAKTISDFALTILDDADAAAVRATIGVSTGTGDALVADPLNQFAATTSAQLAGVISDETGSGRLVFATNATLKDAVITQTANGTIALIVQRFTDTAPTGYFVSCLNQAANQFLFTVDVAGNVIATSFAGSLTGNVTGNVSGSSGSCTGNAATVTTNANLTGPVTSVGNATTIAAGVVTLAMQANMATASLVYRKTGGAGAPEINTLATLKTDLGLSNTNTGDQTITLTGGVTGSGTGSFSATVITNANLTGPVTSVGNATTIAAGVVTEAMQVLADNTTQNFSTSKHGYVPKGTNVGNFLKDDGTWAAAPGGSGTVTSFSAGDLAPLFTTSEATATTTPALTFTLSNFAANGLLAGPTSGSAAAPTVPRLCAADLVPAMTGPGGLLNCTLACSVASNALTIALKTYAGADASAADPIRILFRSPTAATGTWVERTVTGALSLVISSGSTMGFPTNAGQRLWIVLFDDGGTLRLGAVNCSPGSTNYSSFALMALREDSLLSSTAEGGAGAADSLRVIYTGTAVTAKAIRIVGYLDWSAGLATPGTWGIAPTKIQLFSPGVALPGHPTGNTVTTVDGNMATGTTTIPVDDTVPTSSEGNQFMSVAITPTAAPNLIRVSVLANISHDTGTPSIFVGIWRDSTSECVFGNFEYIGAPRLAVRSLDFIEGAVTANLHTYKLRAGANAAGTTTFNGYAGVRYFGGIACSHLMAEEIQGMIHVIRDALPNFAPDPGHTRTAIGGKIVEWSGAQPTVQEVADFLDPPAAVRQAQAAAEAAKLLAGTRPDDVRFRALARATFKALKTLIPALTWPTFKAAILAEMPIDDPVN